MSIASELTNYSNLLATAYNKVEDKGATIPDNKNLQNLTDAIDSIPEGRDMVNGIIEEYKAAAEAIDANTFVEFIEAWSEPKIAPGIGLTSDLSTGNVISAVALDDTHVFIAHGYGASPSLYGIVCTISGAAITVGTDTQITSVANTGAVISAVALDDTHVFIVHRGSSSLGYISGIVCVITGTTITVGKSTQLATTTFSEASAMKLDSTRVFVAHNHRKGTSGTTYSLYGIVCAISGTAITVGTDTQAVATIPSTAISAAALSNNVVFIAHSLTTGDYIQGITCVVSGAIITVGTDTQLQSGYAKIPFVVRLDDVHAFIVSTRPGNSSTPLYGTICTVSGTAITTGQSKALDTSASYTAHIAAVKLDDTHVFVTYNRALELCRTICAISDAAVTNGARYILNRSSQSPISAVGLDDARIFLAHPYDGSKLYSLVVEEIGYDRVTPSNSKIEGLTKTECATSTAGEVWVLNQNS